MMIGKASRGAERNAGLGQRREEFLRIADAGKGERAATAERGEEAGVWLQAGGKGGEGTGACLLHDVVGRASAADHEQRIGVRKLGRERRPQRTGGNDTTIAD